MLINELQPFGAEITGFDIAKDMSPDAKSEIKQALLDHQVLVFRNQNLNRHQHVDFGNQFGTVLGPEHTGLKSHTHHEVNLVMNKHSPAGETVATGSQCEDDKCLCNEPTLKFPARFAVKEFFWMPDAASMPNNTQPEVGIIRAVTVPENAETRFVDMCRIYDALPGHIKELAELEQGIEGVWTNYPVNVHPLIGYRPDRKKKYVWWNQRMYELVGKTKDQSKFLIVGFYIQCEKPEYQFKHLWKAGDIVMYDNKCILKKTVEFDPHLRWHTEYVCLNFTQ